MLSHAGKVYVHHLQASYVSHTSISEWRIDLFCFFEGELVWALVIIRRKS